MRYLIITYVQKPDGRYNESVNVDSKVRNRDRDTASVILDYETKTVVKSRFVGELGSDDRDFDTINNFYKEHYRDLITSIESKYIAIEELAAEVKEAVEKAKSESVKETEAENVD